MVARLMQLLRSTNRKARVASAFWLFGLINNVLYVIILSAAVDLVPTGVAKGIILLADILPAFAAKLVAPYFIHIIPYGARIFFCAFLSAGGMLLVAYTPSVSLKLFGIGVASLSSGLGELTFLGLTHFYGRISLAGFSSGTGAAGLAGAGYYAFATTTLGMSSQATIDVSAILPAIMVLCYYLGLPWLSVMQGQVGNNPSSSRHDDPVDREETQSMLDNDHSITTVQREVHASLRTRSSSLSMPGSPDLWTEMWANLERTRKLLYPYMLPLFLVYTAEYVSISGVAPTLLFPPSESPFKNLRDFYPAYQAIYQAGVFISRSSILLLRLQNIYLPSLLQIANLALLTLQAAWFFLPNVWIVFAIFFWTGLLGGAVYVNAFAKISDEVDESEREFSLSATTVADSTGILLASVIAMMIEPALCSYQKSNGRKWCDLV